MQYLLTLYTDESGWGRMTPEQQQQGTAAYMAYSRRSNLPACWSALTGSNPQLRPQLFAQPTERRRCLTGLSLNRRNSSPGTT